MTRKLGQIIAVRENTWMIRIPMGCDPQTKQRSYYNRTVHGSLRQAQKFLERVSKIGSASHQALMQEAVYLVSFCHEGTAEAIDRRAVGAD